MNVCVIYFKDEYYKKVNKIYKYNTGADKFNSDVNIDSPKYKYPKEISKIVLETNLNDIGYVMIEGKAIINLDFDEYKLKTQDSKQIFEKLKNCVRKEWRQNQINKLTK